MNDEDDKNLDLEIEEHEDVDIEVDDLLPAIISKKEMSALAPGNSNDAFTQYIKEISRYPLLSIEQERALTKSLNETGDLDVARKLVVHNLRLVVKIAMEYKTAWQNTMDLIQEGNVGLMKAVSKYNPDKGAKLSYYASWWIRSYILKHILDNFRLIKIGTTNDQKKLFFNLMKEKTRLESLGINPNAKAISESLGVSEKSVTLMDQRLTQSTGGEVSIDSPLSSSTGTTLGDVIEDKSQGPEDIVADAQSIELLQQHLTDFIDGLKPRDQEIFKKRLLSDVTPSLQSIANEYGVSRERIRQIEERLMSNLKVYMSEHIR